MHKNRLKVKKRLIKNKLELNKNLRGQKPKLLIRKQLKQLTMMTQHQAAMKKEILSEVMMLRRSSNSYKTKIKKSKSARL